jgi:mannosyltransferase OCH1-like enzyme
MKYLDWILLFLCILCIITVIHLYGKPKKDTTNDKSKLKLTSVPKVIHKVYIEHSMTIPKPLPPPIQEAHDSWKIMNPEYTIKYYSGKDCENYLSKHFGQRHLKAFRKLKPYSYKCDFIRFSILYIEGGVYTDWKTVCHIPLKELIRKDTKWISSWDVVRPNMWTGFFVTPPKNPILKTAIDMCLYNIENNIYGSWCLEPTGPKLFGKAFSYHYPQYEHNKEVDENGIQLGLFIPRNIVFKDKVYLQSKCDQCGQTQDWDKGNNYVKMWMNKDIYNDI